jgi:CRP/FNR family transcriptional regulator
MPQRRAGATEAHETGLDAVPLFADLAPATRVLLTTGATRRTYAQGATVFRAGSEPSGIYVVLSGRIRVTRSHDGRRLVVHSEGPGGTLAEVPFFEGGRLPATAEAIEISTCLILDRDALQRALRADPGVAWLFLRRLSMRIRELVERLDRTSSQSVHARLASWIIDRAAAAGQTEFTLGMTQTRLAEEVGTVREVVVRSLAEFRRAGVIAAVGRGGYRITDAEALRARADRVLAELPAHARVE